MVGFKKWWLTQNLTQNCEPQRSSGGTQKKKKCYFESYKNTEILRLLIIINWLLINVSIKQNNVKDYKQVHITLNNM